VVLGLLNFLMTLRTFKKYGKNSESFIEVPDPHQTPEGDRPSSAARGRGLSRKVPPEPQVSSPTFGVGEGSSGAGVNDLEKRGTEQRVGVRL